MCHLFCLEKEINNKCKEEKREQTQRETKQTKPTIISRKKKKNKMVCSSTSLFCVVRLFWFPDRDSGGPEIGTR
jgi:hypothetical protein